MRATTVPAFRWPPTIRRSLLLAPGCSHRWPSGLCPKRSLSRWRIRGWRCAFRGWPGAPLASAARLRSGLHPFRATKSPRPLFQDRLWWCPPARSRPGAGPPAPRWMPVSAHLGFLKVADIGDHAQQLSAKGIYHLYMYTEEGVASNRKDWKTVFMKDFEPFLLENRMQELF